jgi:hypothetical protein
MGGIFLVLALLFAAFFLLNMYFRVKVVKSYRTLSKHGVRFAASDIFSPQKMQEVKAQHPGQRSDIENFAKHMKYSLWMASVFVTLVIILGGVLLYNK